MKILIFEWLNSGGLWCDNSLPDGQCPIQSQGFEMLNAVVADLTAGGSEVVAMVDSRLSASLSARIGLTQREVCASDDVSELLLLLAQDSDWVLVIAPETDGILTRCLNWLDLVEHKLLNPDVAFTKLASNKSDLFTVLEANGFSQFPRGLNFQTYLDQVAEKSGNGSAQERTFELPAVLKPVDGAGSEEVTLIADWNGFTPSLSRPNDQYRLEEFVPGVPVSVSVLCGGDQYDVLVPTEQLFAQATADDDLRQSLGGHYVGAGFPIDKSVAKRAVDLACRVLRSLPKTRGYIGLDLVVSQSGGPSEDRLIEINPRLTMSYSRLSKIYGAEVNWNAVSADNLDCERNLGTRMIEQATQLATAASVTCTFREPCL